MAEAAKAAQAGAETTEAPGLLDQLIEATRPDDQMARARTKDAFSQFLDQVVKPGQVVSTRVVDVSYSE